MATLAQYKEHRSWGGAAGPERIEVIYDFSVDAGAVAALDVLKVKDASCVELAEFHVMTTCTSGGSATVSLGVSGDAAGMIAATAVASLTAGSVIVGAARDASHKLAADAVIQMDTAVAALTAGKIKIVLHLSKF